MAVSGGAEPPGSPGSPLSPSSPPALPMVYERDPAQHDCTTLLQNYVQAQQQQIAILERSLADMARNFGRKEQQLLGQVRALTDQLSRLLAEQASQSPVSPEIREISSPQVNGQDVSKASHEEAVRQFQLAKEPIVVEVLRRTGSGSQPSDANRNPKPEPPTEDESVTVATQTEPWVWPFSPDFPPAPPFSPDFPPAPPFVEDDDIDGSIGDAAEPDVDFEEVTLKRSSVSERLGLTLYYPDGDDTPDATDVLVRGVESGGIAATDGRIRPGDQIIQINGEEAVSKEQAERLLSATPDVTLLLCRPAEQSKEEAEATEPNEEDPQDTAVQVVPNLNLDNRVSDVLSPSGNDSGDQGSLEKKDTMKSGGSSSSGTSSTSGSSSSKKSNNSSGGKSPRPCHFSPEGKLQFVAPVPGRPPACGQRGRLSPAEEHIYETIPGCSEAEETVYCQPYGAPPRRWLLGTGGSRASRSTSSAYNTGDSLTLELAPATRDTALQVSLDSDTYSEVSCRNCRRCMRLPPLAKNKSAVDCANAAERSRNYVTLMPPQTHYTSAERLRETMRRQQRLLQRELARAGQQPRTGPAPPPPPPPAAEEPSHQYKVKVRADGSRYIARRPVRRERLRERAARIAEDRTGVTTDDDNVSELKLGRYWPRDEKRRQLERARERKQKQQQRTKMAAVPEEGTVDQETVSGRRQATHWFPDQSLQKKLSSSSMRRKPHGQEEFLKHAKPPKPGDVLLSVTTV